MTSRLNAIVEEFADLEPRERLELLMDFCEKLPELPPELEARRAAGENRVHECQTPVFLWIGVKEGRTQIYAWVAPDAPTVKGFVGLLAEALSGQPPEAGAEIDHHLIQRLGLVEALGMVRMRGLTGILQRIRTELHRAAQDGEE